MNKGTIALDIDGTITDENHLIPDEVVSHLMYLYESGWRCVLVTGRSFSFAIMSLEKIPFPYYLALQNGADLLKMPEKKSIGRTYLPIQVVRLFEELYQGQQEDFIIYSGYEKGDFCYYRPHRFSEEMLLHFQKMKRFSTAPWKALSSFDIQEQKSFPLIKCFGVQKTLESFNSKLCEVQEIKTSVIQDPMKPGLYMILVTHRDVDKGIAIQKLMQNAHLSRPLIVGGDDNNDIPLLKQGDIRIAMENAPADLRDLADIIAPPSTKLGIIPALEKALGKLL